MGRMLCDSPDRAPNVNLSAILKTELDIKYEIIVDGRIQIDSRAGLDPALAAVSPCSNRGWLLYCLPF